MHNATCVTQLWIFLSLHALYLNILKINWLTSHIRSQKNIFIKRPGEFQMLKTVGTTACKHEIFLTLCLLDPWQEDAVSVVHIIGALMVFGGGILYCWVQSFISYKMKTCGLITNTLFTIRLLIVIAMSIFFISCVTATSFASKDWIRYHRNSSTISHRWDPKDKAYVHHVVGDVSEWLMALSLLGFMFTFFGEFRFVKMKIVVSRRLQNPAPLATGMGSDDALYSLYV